MLSAGLEFKLIICEICLMWLVPSFRKTISFKSLILIMFRWQMAIHITVTARRSDEEDAKELLDE